MVKKNTLLICSLAFFSLMGCKGKNELTVPVNLRTEYLREPIGLDTKSPRFTWEYKGSEKNFLASRSEIRIGTSPDNLQPYTDNMTLEPHTRYYWNVTVWDQDGDICETSETATFETAKFKSSDWSGKWITDSHDKEFEPAPMFRKAFTLGKEIEEARVYVAAAGYYDLFINGKRVGENYLDPGYTHFDKRILYVTHDVTSLLKPGGNAIATVLGNGWHNVQSKAVWNFETARWRNRPRMLCELRLRYTDGTTEVIATDESWRTATGPYTYNNIYSGDKYDATLEENGWNAEGFDDSKWDPVQVTEAPAPLLAAQQMPGIRITEELQPVSMKKFSDKLYVFSFEKNFAGLSRLKVKGAPGTRITLKHGELLKTDGRLEQGNIDVYYHPVKPGEVFQMDVFTLKGTGEEEIFMPSFAYHGFQHVEVESSAPVVLTKESLTGLFMHTAVEPVGSFSCSDPLLNKIWKATMEAYRSNLHSIPTDCPQREKNGWTADAHVAIDLGLLGFDAITLYEKWMNDFIDNQREAGEISGIIPSSGWGYGEWPGPVWDAAMFIIPNALYNYYMFGNDMSFVLNVRKQTPIGPRSINNVLYGTTELLTSIASEECISTQVSLNSPGDIVFSLVNVKNLLVDNWQFIFAILVFLGGGSALSFKVPGAIDIVKSIFSAKDDYRIKHAEAEKAELEVLEKKADLLQKIKDSGINPESLKNPVDALLTGCTTLEVEPIILDDASAANVPLATEVQESPDIEDE